MQPAYELCMDFGRASQKVDEPASLGFEDLRVRPGFYSC